MRNVPQRPRGPKSCHCQGGKPHCFLVKDKTKSPRELYLSNKEETLIEILLVNHPSPQQGDSPREQYLTDK